MQDEKSLIESRSFWAAALALLGVISEYYRIEWLSRAVADPKTINTVLIVAGLLGGVWFRFVSSKRITSVLPKSPGATNSLFALALIIPLGGMLGGCATASNPPPPISAAPSRLDAAVAKAAQKLEWICRNYRVGDTLFDLAALSGRIPQGAIDVEDALIRQIAATCDNRPADVVSAAARAASIFDEIAALRAKYKI